MANRKYTLGLMALCFGFGLGAVLAFGVPSRHSKADQLAHNRHLGKLSQLTNYASQLLTGKPEAFVMDVTVPDVIADFIAAHPNPHIRVVNRINAVEPAVASNNS